MQRLPQKWAPARFLIASSRVSLSVAVLILAILALAVTVRLAGAATSTRAPAAAARAARCHLKALDQLVLLPGRVHAQMPSTRRSLGTFSLRERTDAPLRSLGSTSSAAASCSVRNLLAATSFLRRRRRCADVRIVGAGYFFQLGDFGRPLKKGGGELCVPAVFP